MLMMHQIVASTLLWLINKPLLNSLSGLSNVLYDITEFFYVLNKAIFKFNILLGKGCLPIERCPILAIMEVGR